MKKIYIIDDDLAMESIADVFRFRGDAAIRVPSAEVALREIDAIAASDVVILDVVMAWPENRQRSGIAGDTTTGMELLRELRSRNPTIPVIIYSALQNTLISEALRDDEHTQFLSKWESRSIRNLIAAINHVLGREGDSQPVCFIVHGHNDVTKLALKNFLQNTLGLPEPIILHEQPNMGRTIIEKFEDYSGEAAVVFAILTPDDVGAAADEPDDLKRRGRQNVIFELGYFLGTLGRRSGRVILLYVPPVELPTDIAGVVYIDVSTGVEAAGEKIRKELAHVR